MPQINRIRVNNVKYNFGTQYYDDFIMRFSCKNTIYDLANGGGKSLLMLMLLQNLIPNCTLDEKQPIEKLFRQGAQNTAIHSLIEWKLDSCYRKDKFKYMTTGFCARKGREVGDEGEESTANSESTSVEYFNYCIFYREFGDNDIRNLPLSNGEERITYHGLKNYLKELEKKDFNVSVYIFDKKGEYQNFISRYGLFESQWEIVRGINKTEGHVRTYFETNYRTSRKVVEDLLIEEIIQKSFNNRLGIENDEGQMSQTLLDIKDKLVELSKKHAQMSDYDNQMEAIKEFALFTSSFKDLFEKEENLKSQLLNMLLYCRKVNLQYEEKQTKMESLLERIKYETESEQRAIQTAEVMAQQFSLDKINYLIEETVIKRNSIVNLIEEQKKNLLDMETANDCKDYTEYKNLYDRICETINNRMRDHSDIIDEFKKLACVKYLKDKFKRNQLTDRLATAGKDLEARFVELEETKADERDADRQTAVYMSKWTMLEEEIEKNEAAVKLLLNSGLVIVAENAEQKIMESREELKSLILSKKAIVTELDEMESYCKMLTEKITRTDLKTEMLDFEIKNLKDSIHILDKDSGKYEDLSRVYGEAELSKLTGIISNTYKSINVEIEELKEKLGSLRNYSDDLKSGNYTHTGKHYIKVRDYLTAHYGEDVIDGRTWYHSLNPGQKRDIIKRIPFIEYGFVVKDDFDRIKSDTLLSNFAASSYAVPVISENVIYDTKLEVNTELVAFAMKDLTFLSDEVKVENELKNVNEEIKNLESLLFKLKDRMNVIWDDYEFVLSYASVRESKIDKKEVLSVRTSEYEQLQTEKQKLLSDRLMTQDKISQKKVDLAEIERNYADDIESIRILELISVKNAVLSEMCQKLEECKGAYLQASQQLAKTRELIQERENEYQSIYNLKQSAETELKRLEECWDSIYAFYYDENSSFSHTDLQDYADNFSDQELESKFLGLKAVLNKEASDLNDKEELKNSYSISMDKCRRGIEYRGMKFEAVLKDYMERRLYAVASGQLQAVKNKLKAYELDLRKCEEELNSQSALMNRIEGSIEHGRNQIIEKYGSFEKIICDNPAIFAEQHKNLLKKLAENRKETEKKLDAFLREAKTQMVMEKDLERIVKNSGIEIPEATDENLHIEEADFSGYEKVSAEYEKVQRSEYKKKEEFLKRRESLSNLLVKYHSEELAREVSSSIKPPENRLDTLSLIDNLNETNTYIVLEKDRISKGIEDMERMKSNFENRCVQTCCNIKTELDRLPKLSNINLDDEVISMIGLQIPYIKEEYYKEKMSSYIDETVTGAESFKNPEERLKYIRNRLTWKKLFSVIVTDMNAIRINLYKRERIKDQSRYLRYEEAVGSTGQSQGIYIQFLIAIINYISSINASSQETAVLGKTIFIDNPFGAAKDIYIWEPIFKMLKTNHVQLIVPARGATPAITGRFEVNYILGQKMVGQRQQTVVVDYHSSVSEAQLEYTRMDYEQTELMFI